MCGSRCRCRHRCCSPLLFSIYDIDIDEESGSFGYSHGKFIIISLARKLKWMMPWQMSHSVYGHRTYIRTSRYHKGWTMEIWTEPHEFITTTNSKFNHQMNPQTSANILCFYLLVRLFIPLDSSFAFEISLTIKLSTTFEKQLKYWTSILGFRVYSQYYSQKNTKTFDKFAKSE